MPRGILFLFIFFPSFPCQKKNKTKEKKRDKNKRQKKFVELFKLISNSSKFKNKRSENETEKKRQRERERWGGGIIRMIILFRNPFENAQPIEFVWKSVDIIIDKSIYIKNILIFIDFSKIINNNKLL